MNENELLNNALNSGFGVIAGEYAWVFVVAFALLLFKSTIEATVAGFVIFIGNDYNDDDVIFLNNRPARIVRTSIWSTTFYLYKVEKHIEDGVEKKIVVGGNKVVIDNTKLKDFMIEKPLSNLEL